MKHAPSPSDQKGIYHISEKVIDLINTVLILPFIQTDQFREPDQFKLAGQELGQEASHRLLSANLHRASLLNPLHLDLHGTTSDRQDNQYRHMWRHI